MTVRFHLDKWSFIDALLADESDAIAWFTPKEILTNFAEGKASLPPPTFIKLTELSECITFKDVEKATSTRDLKCVFVFDLTN